MTDTKDRAIRHYFSTEEYPEGCPAYDNATILPDEDNRCSLCSAPNQHAEPTNYDPYYIGDIVAGLEDAVRLGRFVDIRTPAGGYFQVSLKDDPNQEYVAEWGNGKTVYEAARYALGAFYWSWDWES